jgi:riboflavin kinase/FMN adenylyltransferase
VTVGSRDVNSTRIRELLGEGEVEEAAELLARPYRIRGEVVEGDHRGITIGFPTINLAPENEILPARGVYAGHVRFLDDGDPPRDSIHRVVTNVGRRPTFKQSDAIVAEAHLLEFDAQVYGRRVELSFEHHLRAEQRFPGLEALKTQIAADVESARKLLGHP